MILEVNNLYKQFIRGREPFYAVDHVSFGVEKGAFACVVGHSGSGKSTLFHMVAGLLKPTGGRILFDGVDVARSSQQELARLRNRKIGYILQGANLLPNFTILENIRMPYYLSRDKKRRMGDAAELLDYVGLTEARDAYPSQLSGGELRRAAIARALLLSPELILADEPTGSLDSDNAAKIMELFRKISKEGTTVIVSTHDMDFLKCSTTAFRMAKGRLGAYA